MAQRLLGAPRLPGDRGGERRGALRLYGEQSQRVDMVILDLHLADRSGTDVLRALQQAQTPRSKVLLSSGLARGEARARLLEHGARGLSGQALRMERSQPPAIRLAPPAS